MARPSGNDVCMANIVGRTTEFNYRRALAAVDDPDAHVQWYGKSESRPGRKMGHINVRRRPGEAVSPLVERAKAIREAFMRAGEGS